MPLAVNLPNKVPKSVRTVRYRIIRTKGALSPITAKLMVFKFVMMAKAELLPKVVAGVTFKDGTEVIDVPAGRAA